MLRALVALALLLNLGLWAWGQGLLDGLIGPPTAQTPTEPQRLQRQWRPEVVAVPGAPAASVPEGVATAARPASAGDAPPASGPGASVPGAGAGVAEAPASAPGAAASVAPGGAASSPASAAPSVPPLAAPSAPAGAASVVADAAGCLRTGLLTPSERRALRRVATAIGIAETRWEETREPPAPRWAVIMGPLEDGAALRRKQDELARLEVRSTLITDAPDLIPGLVLARAPDATAAQGALAGLNARGVRTARVVDLSTGAPQVRLQLDGLSAEQLARLRAVPLPAAALDGRGVAGC